MKIILKDLAEEDWELGLRAAKWLKARFQKDALLTYETPSGERGMYAKRNKASITVRAWSPSIPR